MFVFIPITFPNHRKHILYKCFGFFFHLIWTCLIYIPTGWWTVMSRPGCFVICELKTFPLMTSSRSFTVCPSSFSFADTSRTGRDCRLWETWIWSFTPDCSDCECWSRCLVGSGTTPSLTFQSNSASDQRKDRAACNSVWLVTVKLSFPPMVFEALTFFLTLTGPDTKENVRVSLIVMLMFKLKLQTYLWLFHWLTVMVNG